MYDDYAFWTFFFLKKTNMLRIQFFLEVLDQALSSG